MIDAGAFNPNSPTALKQAAAGGRLTWRWPVLLLVSRTLLFAFWQGVIALLLAAGGAADPFDASAAWWPITAALTGVVSLVLLLWRFRAEQIPLRAVFGFVRGSVWRDALTALLVFVLIAPLAVAPNLGLAQVLYGDPEGALPFFFRALPTWAAWMALIAFPLSVAATELPTYFGYVMPRVEALSGRRWLGIVLPALVLSAQHSTLPLVLDWRFIAWRGGEFILLALGLGIALRWRPRLLPYLMIGHGLLDLSAAWLVVAASS